MSPQRKRSGTRTRSCGTAPATPFRELAKRFQVGASGRAQTEGAYQFEVDRLLAEDACARQGPQDLQDHGQLEGPDQADGVTDEAEAQLEGSVWGVGEIGSGVRGEKEVGSASLGRWTGNTAPARIGVSSVTWG